MTRVETDKYREILEEVKDEKVAGTLWLRWKCLTDLFFLGYEILGMKEAKDKRGRKLVDPVFHSWLAGVLNTSEDVMVIVPRRFMKTTWVKIKLLQNILRDPFVRQALYSSTADLVEQELLSIKRMAASPKLMNLFPEVLVDPGQKGLGYQINRANQLTIFRDMKLGTPPQEAQIEAFGVGGNPVGKHFDVHIYDDIVTDKNSQTMEQLNKTREWYGYIQGVLEPGGQEIYIGTPYHYEDLTNFIQKEEIFDHVYKRSYQEGGKIIYSYYTDAMIRRLKKKYTPYQFSCNPGDAPIWMGDGSFKDLLAVRVGDTVMGFTTGERSRFVPSKVIAKQSRWAMTVTLTMESGRMIRCTPDHMWYAGQKARARNRPLYAKPAVSGTMDWNRKGKNGPYTTILQHAIDRPPCVTIKEKLQYAWLGGIIDGEGSCKHGSIIITQSVEKNPEVCAKIQDTLVDLDIPFSRWIRAERTGHKTADYFIVKGSRQVKANIIHHARPAKSEQIVSTIIGKKRPFDISDRIVRMEEAREEEVFSMQTETGNYIAWGYGSKNCQMECNPQPMEDQLFPPPQPTFDTLPPGKYNYYISIDPAATLQTYSDETAIIVAAVNEISHVYVVEALHFKKSGDEIAEILLRLNERYTPRKIGIELGLQTHLKSVIELTKSNWEAAQKKGIHLPIEPIPIGRDRSKYQRINLTVGSFVRSKRMWIKSTLMDLIVQMGLYNKNYAGKDDLVDALSMLFSIVEQFSFRYWREPLGLQGVKNMFEDFFKPKKKHLSYSERFSK